MKKRILALTLAFVMLLAMVPAAGAAEPTPQYIDQGSINITNAGTYIITQHDPTVSTTNTITIGTPGVGGEFNVTLRNINIDVSEKSYATAINIQSGAQVTITLEGNNCVKSWQKRAGIQTDDYSTMLTIRGDGSLEAHGGDHAAGIGASLADTCGTITIESGTINAYGGIGAAGIGGGDFIAAGKPTGMTGGAHTINISGGTIYAEGTENPSETDNYNSLGAAGIGSGYWGGNATINISGGDITALGVAKSPCIGTVASCWITISGGTIHTARNPNDIVKNAQEIGGYNRLTNGFMHIDEPGNSIIYVSGPDKLTFWNSSTWKGIVWEGVSGTVYGSVDLTGKDLTIAAGETLTVPGSTEGENPTPTLIISETNFHNNGTITGTGMVQMDGKNYRIKDNQLVLIKEVVPQDTLTITNQPADPIQYGDTFDLGTSGGSGSGAFTWSATGAATVDANGAVTVTGVGSATITATKAGDDTYAEAVATYTFTAEKATPSVGDVTCAASIHPGTDPATVTLNYSGTTGGTVKLTGVTEFELGTKDYDWVFTPDDQTNYTTATGKVSLTVTKAALSGIAVTAQPAKKIYTFGEAFDPSGMVVTATYEDGTTAVVTPTFNSDLAAGQTSLTLSYTEGSVTKTCTLNGLTVNKKAAVMLTAQDSASYSDTSSQTFNFEGLLPSDCGAVSGVTVSSVASSEILASASGDKDAKTVTWALKSGLGNEVKSEVVTATVQTANYEDITLKLTVSTTAKTPVAITGVTVQDATYDGTTHTGYIGTPAAAGYSGNFTVTYSGGGSGGSTAPKNAGTYTVTFAIPADDPTYTGSESLTFTVQKAKIDITANDRIVTVGGTMPNLSATVSGLATGDTLKTPPVVTCDSDLSAVGTFPIKASGAVVPEGGNYEDVISYHDGTLTVRLATDPADLTETGLALWTGRNGSNGPTPSGSYTAGGGTVEWDLSTLTLTLSNAAINATDAQFGTALEIIAPAGSTPEVTIVLNGTNSIRGKNDGYSYGINSQCPLRISGNGTLSVTGGNTSAGTSIGIDCFGLIVDRGASVSAFGGSSDIHSYGLSSSGAVTVAGNLKTVAGNGRQSFGMLVNRGLTVEEGGSLEARARTDSTQSYGIAFNGAANVPVTVHGELTAIGFAPLGNGSAQYQNRVTVRGSYSEDGTNLFGFATSPTSFEANYQANNPKYILIQADNTTTPSTPSGGGGGSYVSGGSNTTTETTTNPDGSQTVVKTEKNGTVTTTETDKDGNKTETVAKPDGSSVTKVAQKNGTTATVTTDTDGKVEAEVRLTAAAVSSAQESGAVITLPIPQVQATKGAETAPIVTVHTGSKDTVQVEIPISESTPGTVAVLVRADGTEEIVKTSVSTADGLAVALLDGATVKIVDNSKTFTDVPADNWAAGAVSFSSARELFTGTSESSFSPEVPMTRAMLVTVLARLDGANTSGGANWYEKGINWAVSKGISDGSDPNGNVTREQLAVMLWRYAGGPGADGQTLDFTDSDQASDWAQEALRWAVQNGIINGIGDGRLDPKGNATRAQAAQILKNFIEK